MEFNFCLNNIEYHVIVNVHSKVCASIYVYEYDSPEYPCDFISEGFLRNDGFHQLNISNIWIENLKNIEYIYKTIIEFLEKNFGWDKYLQYSF